MYDLATYFAWFVLALLFGIVVVVIVWLGSLPKQIAQKRNHPQVDAINVCSWLGLAFGGVGWAIAFIWAFIHSGPAGDTAQSSSAREVDASREIEQLKLQIADLQQRLSDSKET